MAYNLLRRRRHPLEVVVGGLISSPHGINRTHRDPRLTLQLPLTYRLDQGYHVLAIKRRGWISQNGVLVLGSGVVLLPTVAFLTDVLDRFGEDMPASQDSLFVP